MDQRPEIRTMRNLEAAFAGEAIDHLFDQGYITFSPSDQLLVVPEVRTNLLDKWGIDTGTNVGVFKQEQQAFLEYHRVNVFKGG